jgi:hypothetical protein
MEKLTKLNKELRYNSKRGLFLDSLTERVSAMFDDPTTQSDLVVGYSVIQDKYMIPSNLEEGVSEYRHLYSPSDLQKIIEVLRDLGY